MKRKAILFSLLLLMVLTWAAKPIWGAMIRTPGNKTVEDRLQEYGEIARARLKPKFALAGVPYPPNELVLLGIKDEKRLEIYASGPGKKLQHVAGYKILRASGNAGPKLREGDLQVPEGVYPIESLNPNSRFHLSLRIGYPNKFDREQAAREQRSNLGGDIMIHGGAVSIGCLAMGDEAAEDFFIMAADTGIKNIQVVLTPVDFRKGKLPPKGQPAWTATLYRTIEAELRQLPLPKE